MGILLFFAFALIWFAGGYQNPANAQTPEPTPTSAPTSAVADEPTPEPALPVVHVVQDGETLTIIAESYGTDVDTLLLLNNISDPSLIFVGQEIRLPGSGAQGAPTIHLVQLSDSLRSLATRYGSPADQIASQNSLISSDLLVAGRSLVLNNGLGESEVEELQGQVHIVQSGETFLTIAASYGLKLEEIAQINHLPYPAYLVPGQRLIIPDQKKYHLLPNSWQYIFMNPLPLQPGSSAAVYVETGGEIPPAGSFLGQVLQFSPYQEGYVAVFGADAFTKPGIYDLILNDADGQAETAVSKRILMSPRSFVTQTVTIPEDRAHLLDPEIRSSEDAFLASIYTRFTDEAHWQSQFIMPITSTFVTAPYGDPRSYNLGPIEIFHSGVDFAGTVGTPIQAPATGTVVFSDTLTLRGNTLIIDHGLGVMTGYYHLSEIFVPVDQEVTAGQLIARGGSSGLSTGPHLHWDLRIQNLPVDPILWTQENILRNIQTSSDLDP